MKVLEKYLELMADMYELDSSSHDLLNQIIQKYDTKEQAELNDDDLDLVSAALNYNNSPSNKNHDR